MLEFLRRNQVLLSSGLFLTLSFALLTVNRDGLRRFDPLGVVFLEVLRPLQSVTTNTSGRVSGLWGSYLDLVGVEADNQRLRERLRQLEAEHHRDTEIELENHRLQRLLDFRNDVPSQGVTAGVTGKDASGLFQTFTLDRGESDGVKAGMAVVAPDGVVGRIGQASPHASRVLLISDHNSGVDALVQRTRARGIVEGALNGGCSMKYIKRGDDVAVDDVVVTSGLDGIFPKGVLIGTVNHVTRKDVGLFQIAEVTPAAEFGKLEEVWVITTAPQEVNRAIEAAARAKETASPVASATPGLTGTPAPHAKSTSPPHAYPTPPPRGTAAPPARANPSAAPGHKAATPLARTPGAHLRVPATPPRTPPASEDR